MGQKLAYHDFQNANVHRKVEAKGDRVAPLKARK